jgi:hypothetical protein
MPVLIFDRNYHRHHLENFFVRSTSTESVVIIVR